MGVAAVVHAGIGYVVWRAKFQPHYQEAPAEVIETKLVRPPPPPPPPPPPKEQPKHEITPQKAIPRAPPPPTLTPRPTVSNVPTPQVLSIAPAPPAPVKAPPTLAVAAPPAPAPERIHVITNPDWLKTPNGDELARYYPQEAQRNGVQGKATINCAVNEGGNLVDCHVASQSPSDQGFGAAAMKMAGDFKMRPETRDGVPVAGARISIPIKFVLPSNA